MTERLAALLHREADGLDVPVPDTSRILGTGRRQCRRHALVQGAAMTAVAAIALVGGAVAVSGAGGGADGSGRHRSDLPAASADLLRGWAVASGSTVQLGSGHTVHVDGKVKSVYYTSAGVLVRYGAQATTDASDSTYALVDKDGRTSGFRLDLEDRVPSTDPTQPFLVYADATDDPQRWDVVVRDVRTGEVARTVPVSGAFTWGGWVAPPVALVGDHVFVALDAATLDVDLATGRSTPSATLHPSYFPDVAGGHAIVKDRRGRERVIDVATGATLVQARDDEQLFNLSPDGRYALTHSWRTCDDDGRCEFDRPDATVRDLATGREGTIDVAAADVGWTPDGHLLQVTDDAVDVCDPLGTSCRSTPIEVGGENLRLGGSTYES